MNTESSDIGNSPQPNTVNLEATKAIFNEKVNLLPQMIQEFVTIAGNITNPEALAGVPKWRLKAIRAVARVVLPTLSDVRKPQTKATMEGRFAGHLLALFSDSRDPNGFLSKVDPKVLSRAREFTELLSPIVDAVVIEQLKAPRTETTDFFRGVSFAMDRTFDAEEPHFKWTDATEIYCVIGLIPDFIAKMKSVQELHEWLCAVFQRDWPPERTQKICTRIGLVVSPKRRKDNVNGQASH